MKYAQNHPRRSPSEGNQVSLFPFLAVLLCTMGALIAVLLLMARQAQLSTEAYVQEVLDEHREAVSPEVPDLSEVVSEDATTQLRERLEMEQWRLEQLQEARKTLLRQLQESRIAFSTAQSARDTLAEKLDTLRNALAKMRAEESEGKSANALKKTLCEKELELEKLQKSLQTAENNAKSRDGSFAILPHSGKNGTRRYPIYIECRRDGAWLMPENIRLGARDFEGILSMGNPLEAALLTKRQYLLKNGVFHETPDGGQEPYPLILVRPGGIVYLYMVRSALLSWKSEYGFELVEDDWKLAYPPNDKAMADTMLASIAEARSRQEEIASMAPTLSELSGGGGASGGLAYRATSGGPQAMPIDQNSRLAETLRRSARSPQPSPMAGPVGKGVPQGVPNPGSAEGPTTDTPAAASPGAALPDVSQWQTADAGDASPQKEMPGEPASPFNGYSQQKPIAETQGMNWALEQYHPAMTSVSRTVRMECHADRLVLPPAPGTVKPVVIPVSSPEATARLLANRLKERVRSWGEPGTGMYWKPILSVSVSDGGGPVCAMLEAALRNSGLEMEKEGNVP
ncbi:MAG: hypothetical protein Q4D98_11820 [Planctomycetia bacterium]|nr:hypothetical protein [Planctomycetia bacterium]